MEVGLTKEFRSVLMNWKAKQKAIKERGKFRVLCDQDEMDHLDTENYADSYRGARAIKKNKKERYRSLTYSIEEKDKRGFWQKIFG